MLQGYNHVLTECKISMSWLEHYIKEVNAVAVKATPTSGAAGPAADAAAWAAAAAPDPGDYKPGKWLLLAVQQAKAQAEEDDEMEE